ncbi:DUF1934 domain-containing protein [Jeotgalibaca caeni]|uniref:DUF1934 domain-containing protein n=1 Tax=Jeotgalibaca caeni TaxID=3028623 RepID=UPI00237D6E81|nr:DUF1934 domain-containing protein [Jeotgalibaca caeni]MDE1549229.1 DUF1934 domain-containing protein [Jeotgalibaca caeni]
MSVDKSTVIAYRLETTVEQDGEQEIFLYEGKGQMTQLGEWLYLRYQEEHTENKVTIKLSRKGKVTIIRRTGEELLSRMTFDTNEKGSALIPTPVGKLELETTTVRLLQDYKEKPFSGNVRLNYSLGNDEQTLGNYGMSLQFTT